MATITRDVHCPKFGYNLRGLENRQSCPECGEHYDISSIGDDRALARIRLNSFDKFCAALAIVLAVLLLLLGLIGVFTSSSANFTLPPILGGLPALIGWGIIRSVVVAWRATAVAKAALEGR
jgi:hypothetical protein